MEDEKYLKICEKLGCAPSEVKIPDFDTEDDSFKNPFSVLTIDETNYLLENGYMPI